MARSSFMANMPSLPEEVIVEILLRLPVKSLMRFKSVCKSWLSLISDPNFAKLHYNLGAALTHRLFYVTPRGSKAASIDLDASLHDDSADARRILNLPTSFHYHYRIQIVGSCRGFVLLKAHPFLFLWNPTTGSHKRISYTATASDLYLSRIASIIIYGFGYDASTDDYLVLLASHDPHQDDDDDNWGANVDDNWGRGTNVEFLSLRTNSWEKIVCSYLPLSDELDQSALPFNGALHWLATHENQVIKIIAFDFMERNLSKIPVPGDIKTSSCELCVLGECLSLCDMSNSPTVEIWMMKDYKEHSSWTKTFVVSTPDYGLEYNYFLPICFTKGGEIVGLEHWGALMKFNDKGELIEQLEWLQDDLRCIAGMYTESLLSLPTNSEEGGQDDQN